MRLESFSHGRFSLTANSNTRVEGITNFLRNPFCYWDYRRQKTQKPQKPILGGVSALGTMHFMISYNFLQNPYKRENLQEPKTKRASRFDLLPAILIS